MVVAGLHQPPWSFGFQTRGTRENRAPPCVKVPGSSRVPVAKAAATHDEDQSQCRGLWQCTFPLTLPFFSPSFFHTISLSPAYQCVMGRLVHIVLCLSSLVAHVLGSPAHCPMWTVPRVLRRTASPAHADFGGLSSLATLIAV